MEHLSHIEALRSTQSHMNLHCWTWWKFDVWWGCIFMLCSNGSSTQAPAFVTRTKTTILWSLQLTDGLCCESFSQALFPGNPLWDRHAACNGLDTSCCTNPNMPNLVHQDTERDNQWKYQSGRVWWATWKRWCLSSAGRLNCSYKIKKS